MAASGGFVPSVHGLGPRPKTVRVSSVPTIEGAAAGLAAAGFFGWLTASRQTAGGRFLTAGATVVIATFVGLETHGIARDVAAGSGTGAFTAALLELMGLPKPPSAAA